MEFSPIQFLEDAASKNSSDNVCYASTMMSVNGILENENPLNFTLPLFVFQFIIIVITSRLAAIILKPLRQPRYISGILVINRRYAF